MKKILLLALALLLFSLPLAGCGESQTQGLLTGPPETFLCRAADLPVAGVYLVPSAGMVFEITNANLTGSGGEGERAYIEATGRLDGWAAQFKRSTSNASLPEQIYCGSVKYATVEGARLSVLDYNSAARGLEGWELAAETVNIGDESVVVRYRSPDAAETRIWLVIEFSYRNYVIDVGGLGPESGVSLDTLKEVAQAVLEHMQAGTLATVTPAP
jgi:hypothetical protein